MRPQQIAILDAMLEAKSGTTFHLDMGFMTLGELVAGAETVLAELGFAHAVNRNTVQAWSTAGLLSERGAKPELRNRLYSAIDMMLLVGVAVVSRLGFSQNLAKRLSIGIKTQLKHNAGDLLDVKPDLDQQASRLILLSPCAPPDEGHWDMGTNLDQQGLMGKVLFPSRPAMVVVDPTWIVHLSKFQTVKILEAKAALWRDKVVAHVEKLKAKKPVRGRVGKAKVSGGS